MDVPELMRRVLEVAPASIREVFDDHRALTDALRTGDANATCAAMTGHANRVRSALAALLAEEPVGPREHRSRPAGTCAERREIRRKMCEYSARA